MDEPNNPTNPNPAEPGIDGGKPDPAPSYATKDDLAALNATINALTTRLEDANTRFSAVSAGPQPASPPATPQPPTRTVSMDQVNQAYTDGDLLKGAQLLATLNNETVAISQFETDQKIGKLTNFGTNAISANTIGMAKRDKESYPYFDRYEKEIMTSLGQCTAEAKANPDVVRAIYDNVVGQHTTELLKEHREEVLRQASLGGAALLPGQVNGRDQAGKEVLTIEKVYGTEASNIHARLREQRGTPDDFAKRRGYKDFQDWLAFQHGERQKVTATA